MKLADLKPGKIYARQRSKNYAIQPMLFLSADLYRERGRTTGSGPYFRPLAKPYKKWDKPKTGTWGSGSTGYPVCFLGRTFYCGDTAVSARELEILRTASLEEFTRLERPPARPVHCQAPGCGLSLEETEIRGQYQHASGEDLLHLGRLHDLSPAHFPVLPPDMASIDLANERHRLLRYDVLTSLAQVKGDYFEAADAAAAAQRERDQQEKEAQRRRDALNARAGAAVEVVTQYGIAGVTEHPYRAGEVQVTLEALEKMARVIEWASSRGMRHMSQYGPAS